MKERNCSIDMFRLLAAVIVVICHVHMFQEVNEQLYMSVSQQFPRFTVPFFFGVAGYYYIGGLLKGKVTLGKQLKGLLRVYITWSLIYYAASFCMNIILGDGDLITFLVERVVFLFTEGGYSHMWYMVSLIYALIIITAAYKLGGEKGLQFISVFGIVMTVICALGCVYYPYGSQIPVLNRLYDSSVFPYVMKWLGMGVPYVSLGYFVIKLENREKKFSDRNVWIGWGIAWALFFAEIALIVWGIGYYERRELNISVYLLTIMNLIILLRNPLPQYKELAGLGKSLSGFIYFSHPLVIMIVEKAFEIMGIGIHSVVMYVIVIAVTGLGGYILTKSNWSIKKYLM